jgi:hypothetical protein
MRGGALPPALLAAALGFALAFAPRRVLAPAIALFVLIGLGVGLNRIPADWIDAAFYACWASVIATSLSVHWPKSLLSWLALALATNAGLWAGAVIAVAGTPLDFAKSAPLVLLCLPARWLAAQRVSVVIKVVSSWLAAVAILAAALPTTTPTPGYAPDHME